LAEDGTSFYAPIMPLTCGNAGVKVDVAQWIPRRP
jgi:hypothetical protein